MSPKLRLFMLALDAGALVGLIGFSVAAALKRDNSIYLAGQIICIMLVLWSALVLHRAHVANNKSHKEDLDE